MSLKYIDKYKQKDKEEFKKAVLKYASKLSIPADWLMTLMYSESRLNPKIENSYGYVGLIQFGRSARKTLGVTKKELKEMGGAKQMEYVFKYFVNYASKGYIKQFTDLYLMTFYPAVLIKKRPDNWRFPKKVTKANPGIWRNKKINFDGGTDDISVKSFRAWADAKISAEERKRNAVIRKITLRRVTAEAEPEEVEPNRAESQAGFITYVHNYSSIKTLDELIRYKRWNDPGRKNQPSGNELIKFEDNNHAMLTSIGKRKLKIILDSNEDLVNHLVVGARLKIPIGWVQPEFIAFDGAQNVFSNSDTETFISDAMQKATASPEYRTAFLSGAKGGEVRKIIPKPKVWIWCKAAGVEISDEGNVPKFGGMGAVFDLSPFLKDLTVKTGSKSGTFSFSLPPLVAECTKTGWKVRTGSTQEFTSKQDESGDRNFTSKGFVNYRTENNELRRNKFLFHNLISANDVVWISLDNPQIEPIDGLEGANSNYNINNPKISKEDIPNRYWDMIGLVDSNQQSYSSPNVSVGLSVNGRDCMKLLIEDSSYYLTLPEERESVYQTEGLFVNDNPKNWGRPARVSSVNMTSKLFSLQITSARTVGEMMSFIISSMAAIEIAPDSLFSGYQKQAGAGLGFGISKYEFFDYKTNKHQTFKAAGLWQIIKLQIDDYAVNDRCVIENRLAVHSGSLSNAMKIFADDRFIEFFGDTYCDQYFIIVRRPPFNKKGVFDYLTKITGAAPIGIPFEVDTDERKASSPKTLKKSDEFIESQITGGVKENGQSISDSLVVQENLGWYTGPVYSWYRISLPTQNAPDRTFASDKFPVVFFREYCEIWGNKSLDVQSNYMPWNKIPLKARKPEVTTTFETQIFEDLAYLIESNAYLPFTRNGTITIKGDRRIKAKTWIRYLPTGEVFYVEAVSNNYSINSATTDRTTTLTVSRGMIEYNASGQYILPLYFKIIDGLNNSPKAKKDSIKSEVKDSRILNVYFDFDKDTLIVPDRVDLDKKDLVDDRASRLLLAKKSDDALTELLVELTNTPDIFVELTGNTDENGDAFYNEDLSLRRAKNVKSELVRMYKNLTEDNIPELTAWFARRISVDGAGEAKPLKSNKGTTGKQRQLIDAKNRRIELKIVKKAKVENNPPSDKSKQNDFSSWRVNPSVFNFFNTRRQMCERVQNLESIADYVEQVQPEDIVTTDTSTKPTEEEIAIDVATGAMLHHSDTLLNKTSKEYKNIEVVGKYEDEDDNGRSGGNNSYYS